jgi:D-psicose/D-tagatose/L-ribulose 3-epimerase
MAQADGRPQIGISTFVWHSPLTTEALAELAPRLAGWGYDAVGLPLENPGDWDAERAREILDDAGLAPTVCGVMAPGRELVAASDDVIASTQDYLRHCVDVAVTLGATQVVGPIYTSVGRTWRMPADERKPMIDALREGLRPVADHAGEHGVSLGIEPLNRYETSVITTTEQVLELVDGLPRESVGLSLDTYHMNIEEKSISAALRAAGDRLVNVEVSANDRGAPGQDHIDWDDVRAALVDVGYSGVCAIESFTPDNETIATAASIWRPLAASPDQLAQDGLAFLKRWREGWPA